MTNQYKINNTYLRMVDSIKIDGLKFFWDWHHSNKIEKKKMLQTLATKFENRDIPRKKVSVILGDFLFKRGLMARMTARNAIPTKYKNDDYARNV